MSEPVYEPLFRANALIAYKEDIENRGFWDWLRATTSFLQPLHKYKGEIRLFDDILEIEGKADKGESTLLVCTNKQLKDVYLGYDETFTIIEDRAGGLSFQPIRLQIDNGNKNFSVYIILNFNSFLRTSENVKWKKILSDWMKSR